MTEAISFGIFTGCRVLLSKFSVLSVFEIHRGGRVEITPPPSPSLRRIVVIGTQRWELISPIIFFSNEQLPSGRAVWFEHLRK